MESNLLNRMGLNRNDFFVLGGILFVSVVLGVFLSNAVNAQQANFDRILTHSLEEEAGPDCEANKPSTPCPGPDNDGDGKGDNLGQRQCNQYGNGACAYQCRQGGWVAWECDSGQCNTQTNRCEENTKFASASDSILDFRLFLSR